jgi:hypothetical protein
MHKLARWNWNVGQPITDLQRKRELLHNVMELTRSWCAPSPRNSRCERREHRPGYLMGGVLAQVGGHQFDDARRFARRLRLSLRGQSWAEKSLKNGRILVEFQILRKPQDANGTYFPSILPSTLPEWGSGGRWFESSRPDTSRKGRGNHELRQTLRLLFSANSARRRAVRGQ